MPPSFDRRLPPLPAALQAEMLEKGQVLRVGAGTELLRTGQYVRAVPLVLEGLVKVFSSHGERDLLLYYIAPAQGCVMSFSAGLWQAPSRVCAVAEEETELLLLPVAALADWTRRYPALNALFFQFFTQRYEDLLDTIHQVLFESMDKRLLDFLRGRAAVLGSRSLDLRHHQIARELGTAREVVSRVLKKLEQEGHIRQTGKGIELLLPSD